MGNNKFEIASKSDEKSNEYREVGNEQYIRKKKFIEALISYNKSITYANSKENLSLGYGNRSAVYFELERYEECLENIKLARENNYPQEKIFRLDLREERCKKLMQQQPQNNKEDPWEFFKLSYPANEKVPWVADCVEVRTTRKYGRGIYATKKLKAGDIICIEQPVINVFKRDALYRHCYNCFKTNMMNLIPCAKTASLMFCSTGCMDSFYSKIEDINLALNDGMRILSEITASFGGYKDLKDFINKSKPKELKKTIFDYDFSDPNHPFYNRDLMKCLLSLSTTVKEDDKKDPVYKYISKKAADHILAIANTNFVQTAYGSGDLRAPLTDGFEISLFRSLINHSCLSNVIMVYIDNKIATIVSKPIKKGEQLFQCYYAKNTPKHKINKILVEKNHKFKCDCQECNEKSYRYKKTSDPIVPAAFMNRNDFTKGKELLMNGWEEINENGLSRRRLANVRRESISIIGAIAYYATFPN